MKKYPLNNGLEIPALGLGTWNATDGSVGRAVIEAINCGYRHIDCAMIYQNEKEVGQALKECFDSGKVRREDLWITSKLWCNSHAPEDVKPALLSTLADLELEYLDLYLIHWPIAFKKDVLSAQSAEDLIPLKELPNEKTWKAMEELQKEGLVKSIGVSNFSIQKLKSLLDSCQIRPAVNQVEVHPYNPQDELIFFCKEQDIHVTAYSPLGSPGRPDFMRASEEPHLLSEPTVLAAAENAGCTPGQTLLHWVLSKGLSTIPKSSSASRIQENLQAAELKCDVSAISEIEKRYRFINPQYWMIKGVTYEGNDFWD